MALFELTGRRSCATDGRGGPCVSSMDRRQRGAAREVAREGARRKREAAAASEASSVATIPAIQRQIGRSPRIAERCPSHRTGLGPQHSHPSSPPGQPHPAHRLTPRAWRHCGSCSECGSVQGSMAWQGWASERCSAAARPPCGLLQRPAQQLGRPGGDRSSSSCSWRSGSEGWRQRPALPPTLPPPQRPRSRRGACAVPPPPAAWPGSAPSSFLWPAAALTSSPSLPPCAAGVGGGAARRQRPHRRRRRQGAGGRAAAARHPRLLPRRQAPAELAV